jgi:mRNA-capping enzyme
MVIDKVGGQDVPRYLIYDIVKFEGVNVGATTFSTRLTCITRELIEPRQRGFFEGKLNKALEPFSVRLKEFFNLEVTGHLLSEKFRKTLAHEPDGIVFQPVNLVSSTWLMK